LRGDGLRVTVIGCQGTAVACAAGMKVVLLFSLLLLATSTAANARSYNTPQRSKVLRRAVLYDAAIKATAARYSVDPRLLWTIAYLESGFQPEAVSRKGARGLMQFIPSTGRKYGLVTIAQLHDPLRSIDAATRFVRDLSRQFDGRIDLVLAGYNAGERAVINANNEVPRYRETRAYVARGLSIFRRICQGAPLDPILTRRAGVAKKPIERRQAVPSKAQPSRSIYFSP